MKIISVLNHKGGVGKSTIATNIAGYFANRGKKVLMGDFDVQQSSHNWLALRPENAAPIHTWEVKNNKVSTPRKDMEYIIVDSPAGIKDGSLKKLVSISDKIIVPLKPGIFDILSTQSFLEELVETINNQEKDSDLCVVGSMVDPKTKSAEQLNQFLVGTGLEVPSCIKQSQIYVHLAAHGLTLFDSKNNIFEKEIKEQWVPLLKWILKPT